MLRWPVSIKAADVEDKPKLEAFRELAPRWQAMFDGESEHSISTQLSEMFWNDAAWRTLNHARSFSADDGHSAAVAPMIAGLLDRGYLTGQVLAIGKLLEPSEPKPQRGVISLRRVVDEIDANQELFTREIFVCHDGLPYDWQAAFDTAAQQQPLTDARWVDTDGPTAWGSSLAAHEAFDRIAHQGTKPRSRTDRVSAVILKNIKGALSDEVFGSAQSLRARPIMDVARS